MAPPIVSARTPVNATESGPPLPTADLLITNAAEILTCVPRQGDWAGKIPGGSIAIAGERILAVGSAKQVTSQVKITTKTHRLDASDKVIAPGFVDSHTHLVFGGSRLREYAARLTLSADQVKAMGIPVGILATVAVTRQESEAALQSSAGSRLEEMFRHGTTTVEIKSGYGLNVEAELKMLAVNRQLDQTLPIDIFSTFLGAHDFPPDSTRQRYIDMVIREMIQRVADAKLATFCDVYCDDGYYSLEESRRILEAGLAAGLKAKIHTNAYSDIGGAGLAADIGVISADHLNYTKPEAISRLAQAGVTGVVMPALDFCVRHPRPFDARGMIDGGLILALATDLCPACYVMSMQIVMALACRLYQLSPEEALWAATAGGARALGLEDRGALNPGLLADLQIWDSPTGQDVVYRIGHNSVETVIKRGEVYSFIDPAMPYRNRR
jgi:imidazolonepropionase